MNAIWTETAKYTNDKNIDYILTNWDLNVLENYLNKVDEIIEMLCHQPNAGSIIMKFDCRKFLVVKQIYLLYRIENNTIVLLNFWNNYQRPIW